MVTIGEAAGSVASNFGLFYATDLWRDYVLYYLLLLFTSMQLQVYRHLRSQPAALIQHMRQIEEATWIAAAVRVLSDIFAALIAFWRHNGLVFNYVAFGVVALQGHVSVIKLGYLCILLVGLHMHQYVAMWTNAKAATPAFRRFW